MKKSSIKLVVLFVTLFFVAGVLSAGSIANQTVLYTVPAIYEIAVTGAPTLTIAAPAAGALPTEVTDSTSAKYAITTNGSGLKITGKLADAMPTGVILKINIANPTTGLPTSDVTFTAATAVDLVTGVTQIAASNLAITYKLSTTLAAVVVSSSKVVTLTITDTANTVFP